MRLSLLIPKLLISSFAVCAIAIEPHSMPISQECTPSSGVDPNATCTRPITGCICSINGNGTIVPLADCGGCIAVFSGSLDCTGGVSTPYVCNLELSCNAKAYCGTTCPCTHADYLPLWFKCGPCQ